MIVSGSSVDLGYWASGDAGIVRTELWSDGQVYATQDVSGQPSLTHVQYTWSSQTLGDHTIFLRAYDTLGRYGDSATLVIGVGR